MPLESGLWVPASIMAKSLLHQHFHLLMGLMLEALWLWLCEHRRVAFSYSVPAFFFPPFFSLSFILFHLSSVFKTSVYLKILKLWNFTGNSIKQSCDFQAERHQCSSRLSSRGHACSAKLHPLQQIALSTHLGHLTICDQALCWPWGA